MVLVVVAGSTASAHALLGQGLISLSPLFNLRNEGQDSGTATGGNSSNGVTSITGLPLRTVSDGVVMSSGGDGINAPVPSLVWQSVAFPFRCVLTHYGTVSGTLEGTLQLYWDELPRQAPTVSVPAAIVARSASSSPMVGAVGARSEDTASSLQLPARKTPTMKGSLSVASSSGLAVSSSSLGPTLTPPGSTATGASQTELHAVRQKAANLLMLASSAPWDRSGGIKPTKLGPVKPEPLVRRILSEELENFTVISCYEGTAAGLERMEAQQAKVGTGDGDEVPQVQGAVHTQASSDGSNGAPATAVTATRSVKFDAASSAQGSRPDSATGGASDGNGSQVAQHRPSLLVARSWLPVTYVDSDDEDEKVRPASSAASSAALRHAAASGAGAGGHAAGSKQQGPSTSTSSSRSRLSRARGHGTGTVATFTPRSASPSKDQIPRTRSRSYGVAGGGGGARKSTTGNIVSPRWRGPGSKDYSAGAAAAAAGGGGGGVGAGSHAAAPSAAGSPLKSSASVPVGADKLSLRDQRLALQEALKASSDAGSGQHPTSASSSGRRALPVTSSLDSIHAEREWISGHGAQGQEQADYSVPRRMQKLAALQIATASLRKMGPQAPAPALSSSTFSDPAADTATIAAGANLLMSPDSSSQSGRSRISQSDAVNSGGGRFITSPQTADPRAPTPRFTFGAGGDQGSAGKSTLSSTSGGSGDALSGPAPDAAQHLQRQNEQLHMLSPGVPLVSSGTSSVRRSLTVDTASRPSLLKEEAARQLLQFSRDGGGAAPEYPAPTSPVPTQAFVELPARYKPGKRPSIVPAGAPRVQSSPSTLPQ